jgi:hypothetical protein
LIGQANRVFLDLDWFEVKFEKLLGPGLLSPYFVCSSQVDSFPATKRDSVGALLIPFRLSAFGGLAVAGLVIRYNFQIGGKN